MAINRKDSEHTLTFSDGVTFRTDGPLRITRRSDGYYVVGNGMLCAVDDYDEGEAMIKRLTGDNRREEER